MPIQLKRLLILGLVLVSIFFVLKYLLTPESFGQYGHYRGNALVENATHDAKYVGSEACVECHEDIVEEKTEGFHNTLACENCHGPGYMHVLDSENELQMPDSREFCAKCHAYNRARPANAITQIDIEDHNPEEKCIECHYPHQP